MKNTFTVLLHKEKLNSRVVTRLFTHGFIAVRVDDPGCVRLLSSEPSAIDGDAVLVAALRALKVGNQDGYTSKRKEVLDSLLSDLLISAAKDDMKKNPE